MNEVVIERETEFASDLGLAVGKWPDTIITRNGRTYTFSRVERDNEGDIMAVKYTAPGRILTVFND